ncbi:hypothetical protein BJY52DRAFT_271671 [Lactarius psammicola]|nr:hypothetical protein BJY52DRAFT_271671 [Lactarius psammicola]
MSNPNDSFALSLLTTSGFSTTTSSTVQQSSSATPAFQFVFNIGEMYTCGIAEVRWTFSGVAAPMSFNITNVNVVQQAPLTSSDTNSRQSITSGTPSATRSVAQRDISRRQYSGYGGSYLPPIDEQLATGLDPFIGLWRWSSVNVPQGWYQMLAIIQGVPGGTVSSSSFFIQNGTDVDCILQFLPTSSTSTSLVQTSATVNGTTTGTPSKAISHTGAIAGATIGGVTSVILAIGAIVFVWRRRRHTNTYQTVGPSFSNTLMRTGTGVTVAPFNPIITDTSPPDAGSQIDRQQQRSNPIGTPTIPLNPGPSLPEPLLLSSQHAAPIPVGLSDKELALLRSRGTHNQLTPAGPPSGDPQPTLPPIITTEQGEATQPAEARALQSEVEYLRREVQRLHARQSHIDSFEAPPSYGEARSP